MPFKLNIAESTKTWKVETSSEALIGKKIGDSFKGSELSLAGLEDYEFKIQGASDIAGFPHKTDVEGPGLKRVLLTKGWGMHETHEGLRKRKTVRGKQLSEKTVQVNLVILKKGSKSLEELFPDQNKPKEAKTEAAPAQ